jgi:hypothetical protein
MAAAEQSGLLGPEPRVMDGASDADSPRLGREPGESRQQSWGEPPKDDAGHAVRQQDPTVRPDFADVVQQTGHQEVAAGALRPKTPVDPAAMGLIVDRQRTERARLRRGERLGEDSVTVTRNRWSERAEPLAYAIAYLCQESRGHGPDGIESEGAHLMPRGGKVRGR